MARLVSEGRKREFAAFGWAPSLIPDPEKPETFERSKLKWGEVILGLHAEMMTWYRDLIHLRRSTPSLNDGQPWNTVVRFSQQEKWFTIDRGSVRIHCNLGSEERHLPIPVGKQLAMRSRSDVLANDGQLILAKDSAAILVAKAE
jgi:maltooligosyltrehalose trehalohydrolase